MLGRVAGVDRVEEFLGDRLRGRPVPADLHRLVELHLDGVLDGDDGPRGWEVRLLAPGESHPLQEPPVSYPWAPVTDAVLANARAIAEVLTHVAVVADGFDGHLFGYWLHPDEPPDPNPTIVMLDSEGQFSVLDGTTLVDALGPDAEFCDAHGIPHAERSPEHLRRANPTTHPAVLHDAVYEREKRYRNPLAITTDDTVPSGIACDDPRVIATLSRHGFPPDLTPLIGAADAGTGEVTLATPACAGSIELRQQDANTWYLHLMTFRQPDDHRPQCTDLPFGYSLDESRTQAWARFGEPGWKGAQGNTESWRFGPLELHVTYGADDRPQIVRVFPESLVASFRYFG